MKNVLKKWMLLLCALMLAAAMTACGSGGSDDKKDEAKEETAQTDEASDDASDDASSNDDASADDGASDDAEDGSGDAASGKFESLDAFVSSDMMQAQLESQIASLEESGLSCELTAEDGNKLVYNYTILDEAVAVLMDKETLDASLTEMADTFTGVANMIPAAVDGVENPIVVVRYLDNTGAEITSMEFPAE